MGWDRERGTATHGCVYLHPGCGVLRRKTPEKNRRYNPYTINMIAIETLKNQQALTQKI
jgi:hypothetical protein